MEPNTLIDELKELATNEDALAVSKEVNDIKARFDTQMLEMERVNQVAAMEAEINGEEYSSIDIKSIKDSFYEIYLIYRERRKEQAEAKESSELANLKIKKQLIEKLKSIIANEENIGAAFSAYKEIHETWKGVGDIPRNERDTIQQEYSRALEDFFYNMKIYKELKDHDLKRNSQLKNAVIDQLKTLIENQNIKDVEQQLKLLQNEWEEIGPVANEEWEKLKDDYWENVRALYNRINNYYEDRKTLLADNLKKKQEIVEETIAFINTLPEEQSIKSWEEWTNQLLTFQERWKSIGFGPRKENEDLWGNFRAECDKFFDKKRKFYSSLQEKNKVIIDAKKLIIAEAQSLKDSQDWKSTSDKFVKLQQQWKKSGHAGQRAEQKLWSEFRGICDSFFNTKQQFYQEQDKALETNLIAKQTLIANIESYQLENDKKKALQDLKNFSAAFNAIGRVPLKDKDANYQAYKNAIDKLYAQLKLEGEEKEKVLFQARIETLSASPDATKALNKEKSFIRQQIEQLKSDVRQYENNLGFFSKSKGSEQLRKEVEAKINVSKSKIDALVRKMKMIPNE